MLDPANLPKLVSHVFMGFGAIVAAFGVFLTFDDPTGVFVIAFGAVFATIGWFAGKAFAPPKGKKPVAVVEDAFEARSADGLAQAMEFGALIYVDADADDREIEATRREWARRRFEERRDWTRGRIRQESARQGGLHLANTVAWTVMALPAVGAALVWGGDLWFLWLGAVPASAIALALIYMMATDRFRLKTFGESVFAMTPCPAISGEMLEGVVETPLPLDQGPRGGFEVILRCQRRWRESHGAKRNWDSIRVETIWESTIRSEAAARGARLDAPVTFPLPTDAPTTTLADENRGVQWRLEIRGAEGSPSYRAEFVVPVLNLSPTNA